MSQITEAHVLRLLRTGSPGERKAFLHDLPPNGFKNSAEALIGSANPGMVVVCLGGMIVEYCCGSYPEVGAVLAAATHERALELWRTVPDHGLLPTTLSGLALGHVKALTLLGRSEEVLRAACEYIPLCKQLNEKENLASIEVLRIEALVNLKRIDEADAGLHDKTLFKHPIAGIEAKRLRALVDSLRRTTLEPKAQASSPSRSVSSEDLLAMMSTAFEMGFGGKAAEPLKEQLLRLDPSNRLDPEDPKQFKQLLTILRRGEELLGKGGEDSEQTVRGKIREAAAIFKFSTPPADAIQRSLEDLIWSLAWSRKHGVFGLENDALWGIYLCNSRLDQPSAAADALIQLRGNLETVRRGIKDPLQRGGTFSAYPYLFNALCEKLYKAGRAEDLLTAIESSKGRVIADRLTAAGDEVVADSAIYESVQRLPDLVRRGKFHYLTYFVDESRVYAVLVSKNGAIHAIDPVEISNTQLKQAAASVAPRQWNEQDVDDSGAQSANVSDGLSPLVAWLDGLLERGIVDQDDHVCYSADDDFNNVPLHYLRFRDGILLDAFSVSRVHSAFHLERVLRDRASHDLKEFAGFVVPLQEDLEKQSSAEFIANLDAPLAWLEEQGLEGESARLSEATLGRVVGSALDHRVVHFSTHGFFPAREGNPFHDSYLLLADETGLPDRNRVSSGMHTGRLTPKAILDSKISMEGSHVSMMACVSGLAKEGIAGDSLGLDWAFIQAGASSLLSTHWNIGAARAAEFFRGFYERWIADGQSRASAFRLTVLDLLEDDRTPEALHRWTAFSLTGDFR